MLLKSSILDFVRTVLGLRYNIHNLAPPNNGTNNNMFYASCILKRLGEIVHETAYNLI